MGERDAAVPAGLRVRATRALRERRNWEQLAKFCLVGAVGYVVNLVVYVALLDGANLQYRLAATGSFLVAVTNNYLWNRLWTFRHDRGHFGYQGLRFLVVSVIVYLCNLAILTILVELGLGKIVAQAIAIVLVTPANFIGNKLWSFSETALRRLCAVAGVVLAAAVFVTSASAADTKPRLTKERAVALFLANDKVADWLDRYPVKGRLTDATYESDSTKCAAGAQSGCWTVHVWWKKNDRVDAGEIAQGKVDDGSTRVTEAWTGPQVAWKMARGYAGAFGGKKINSLSVWLAFCAAFLLGLLDFRRPLSLRNFDLLALLSFSVSLWFFNHGNIFTSVPLAYPPLAYLLARCVWIGARGRPVKAARPIWKPAILLAAAVFLMGFRIGLNVEDSNVIDVGYAGVIGAERISTGVMPYDHFPKEDNLKACGPADSAGEIRDRIQFNGRCESANPLGDTYGPVAYEAYLPGYWIRGWSGKWDNLPAVHLTSIIFDVLCALGLGLVGLRFGGRWLGAALAFAWAAFPFTQYVSMSNTNDAIVPVFLIFGLWLASSPLARGAAAALSGWTKFATLVVAPMWLTYPGPIRWRRPRPALLFATGFLAATVLAFSVLLLDAHPIQAAQIFYDRTLKTQITRESPFSLWDWAQYHARGIPDLHVVQWVLEGLLVAGAIAAAFFPRVKTPLQLAALTGALLIGFELVLTHWFYLYIPWFFPFVAFALLAHGREQPEPGI